jgi:hypothetical protein
MTVIGRHSREPLTCVRPTTFRPQPAILSVVISRKCDEVNRGRIEPNCGRNMQIAAPATRMAGQSGGGGIAGNRRDSRAGPETLPKGPHSKQRRCVFYELDCYIRGAHHRRIRFFQLPTRAIRNRRNSQKTNGRSPLQSPTFTHFRVSRPLGIITRSRQSRHILLQPFAV